MSSPQNIVVATPMDDIPLQNVGSMPPEGFRRRSVTKSPTNPKIVSIQSEDVYSYQDEPPNDAKSKVGNFFNPLGWSWSKTLSSLVYTILFFGVFGAIASGQYNKSITVQPESVITQGKFSGAYVGSLINELCQAPHPMGSYEMVKVRQKYIDIINNVIQTHWTSRIPDRKVEVLVDDLSPNSTYHGPAFAFLGNQSLYIEGDNIYVRIYGYGNRRDTAIAASAHTDTKPTSLGAVDDTAGTSTMINILAALAYHPQLKHDVILNFVGKEEMGMMGAYVAKKKSAWFNDTRIITNLEGSGAGGKPLIFRTNSGAAMNSYLSGAPFPHANTLANNVFASGIIDSRTDYDVYTATPSHGGLDFAFYERRYVYHTARDNPARLSVADMQLYGENALATIIKQASTDDYVLNSQLNVPVKNDNPAYSDAILNGGWLWSWSTYLILLGLILGLTILFLVVRMIWLGRHGISLGPRTTPVLKAFGIHLVCILASLGLGFGFAMIPASLNKAVFYRQPFLLVALLLTVWVLCYSIVIRLFQLRDDAHWREHNAVEHSSTRRRATLKHVEVESGSKLSKDDYLFQQAKARGDTLLTDHEPPEDYLDFRNAFHSNTIFYTLGTILALAAAIPQINGLNYAVFYGALQCSAALIYHYFYEWAKQSGNLYKLQVKSWLWIVVHLIAYGFPTCYMIYLYQILVAATGPLIIEGLGETTAILAYSVFLLPIMGAAYPLLCRANRGGMIASLALVCLIGLLIAACTMFPFTYDTPYKYRVFAWYRPDEGVSDVEIRPFAPGPRDLFIKSLPQDIQSQLQPNCSIPYYYNIPDTQGRGGANSLWLHNQPPPIGDYKLTTTASMTNGKRTVDIVASNVTGAGYCQVNVQDPIPNDLYSYVVKDGVVPPTPEELAGMGWSTIIIKQSIEAPLDWHWRATYSGSQPLTVLVQCEVTDRSRLPMQVKISSTTPEWMAEVADSFYSGSIDRLVTV